MPPVINKKNCTACGTCINICPQDVFWGSELKKIPVVTYPEECWHCNACIFDCPAEDAIKLRMPLPMMAVIRWTYIIKWEIWEPLRNSETWSDKINPDLVSPLLNWKEGCLFLNRISGKLKLLIVSLWFARWFREVHIYENLETTTGFCPDGIGFVELFFW